MATIPTITTKAAQTGEHLVFIDGKEQTNLRIALFSVGNGSRTYSVMQRKGDGWARFSGERAMRLQQAKDFIAKAVYRARVRKEQEAK